MIDNNSLVRAAASQLTADADEKKSSSQESTHKGLDLLGLGAAMVAAFTTLASTDLADIASGLKETLQSPIAVSVVIGAFVYMAVKA